MSIAGEHPKGATMHMQTSDKFTDPRYFAKHPYLEYAYILSTLLSQIVTQASANATLPLLEILSKYFHSGNAERTWFMSSFSLAQGTLILISGRLGDIFGLRRVLLAGYAWTVIWSVLAGISSYMDTAMFLIFCRAMCGAGLAFVLPNALGSAGRIYRPGSRRKHMVFSLIGVCGPVGGCVSPIVTGLIGIETPHWEWAFYHYAIAVAFALLLAYYSVPFITPLRYEEPTVAVDWIGCFLGLTGLVLLNFSWTQAPVAGWDTPYIIVLLIISVLALIFFFWYEAHVPSNPLLPKQIMNDRIMVLTLLTLLLSWGSFGILFYRFFVFVEQLRHYNAFEAGLSLWPGIPSGMTAALVCGLLISKVRAQFLLVFSMLVFVSSDVMILKLPVDQTYFRESMGLWILSVWGMDWSFPAGSIILSDELPARFQGMAGSLLTTMTMYGQSLFVGIASTVEDRVMKNTDGDILAAHRACIYFALGLSCTAVITSIIVSYMTLKKKNRPTSLDEDAFNRGFTAPVMDEAGETSLRTSMSAHVSRENVVELRYNAVETA